MLRAWKVCGQRILAILTIPSAVVLVLLVACLALTSCAVSALPPKVYGPPASTVPADVPPVPADAARLGGTPEAFQSVCGDPVSFAMYKCPVPGGGKALVALTMIHQHGYSGPLRVLNVFLWPAVEGAWDLPTAYATAATFLPADAQLVRTVPAPKVGEYRLYRSLSLGATLDGNVFRDRQGQALPSGTFSLACGEGIDVAGGGMICMVFSGDPTWSGQAPAGTRV